MVAVVMATAALAGTLGFNEPASANQPNAALEFTLHVGGCNTEGDLTDTCIVTEGSTFVASVSLDEIPKSYQGVASAIGYSGVGSKDNPDMDWPGCVGEAQLIRPAMVHAACLVGPPFTPVTYTGTIMTASFNCTEDGALNLIEEFPYSELLGSNQKDNTEAGPDVLKIDCVPATAEPTAQAVGGVALGAEHSNRSAVVWFAGGLATLLCGVLGYAWWQAIR